MFDKPERGIGLLECRLPGRRVLFLTRPDPHDFPCESLVERWERMVDANPKSSLVGSLWTVVPGFYKGGRAAAVLLLPDGVPLVHVRAELRMLRLPEGWWIKAVSTLPQTNRLQFYGAAVRAIAKAQPTSEAASGVLNAIEGLSVD